jgi:acetyl-CoA acetyltransferase
VKDAAAIVGIAESEYVKWGKLARCTEYQLALETILRAVDDAGLTMDDVDGFASFSNDRNEFCFVATDLGVPEVRYAGMTWIVGGGGACAAIADAAMAIATGAARCVVVYRSIAMGQFQRFGRALSGDVRGVRPQDAALGFALPFGLVNATVGMALVVRRHMHLYGTTTEHLGHVAVTFRRHANRNPAAVMHDKAMTLADHAAAPRIVDPFGLLDCCLETDGACALVLVAPDRARDCRHRPVWVMAAAQGSGPRWGCGAWAMQYMPEEDFATGNTQRLARTLWETAGVAPGEVDVAQLYDHYSGMVLLQLEDMGFCARGEGGPLAASGALAWPDGALPTNTAGGSLSEAYIHGLNHVVEGVKQLRGTAVNQVRDAELCAVASGSGIPTSALLLRR